MWFLKTLVVVVMLLLLLCCCCCIVVFLVIFFCNFFFSSIYRDLLGSFEFSIISIATLDVGNMVKVPPSSSTSGTEREGNSDILDDQLAQFTSNGSNHFFNVTKRERGEGKKKYVQKQLVGLSAGYWAALKSDVVRRVFKNILMS